MGTGEYRRLILNRVDQDHRHLLKVHLAVPDIEGWIVAERIALAAELRLTETAIGDIPRDAPGAEYVNQLFKKAGRRYAKTKDGVALLQRLQLRTLYDRCPAARQFLEEVAEVCSVPIASVL
jgi:hypothetical protein